MRRLFATRRRKAAVVIVAMGIAAGAAWAAWSVFGDGNGAGKVATLQPLSVQKGSTPPADIVPGPAGTGTLSLSVSNPNSIPLTITDVSQNGTPTTSDDTNCPGSLFSLDGGGLSGLSIALPANQVSQVSIPNALRLSTSAPTACQGVSLTFPVHVVATT